MNKPLRGETPDLEEPKYKIRFTGPEVSGDKENVSTAQVQFWLEYLEDFDKEAIRVDLLTNEYHPQHVVRLDESRNGPLIEQAFEALTQ